jgi:hypothetical protein
MKDKVSQPIREELPKVIGLESNEIILRCMNASALSFESLLEGASIPKIEWNYRTNLGFGTIYALDGIKDGALVLTDRRIVFLRSEGKREGVTIWKTRHYEIGHSVDYRDISDVNVKKGFLRVFHRVEAAVEVLNFGGFHEIDPVNPGLESLIQTIDASEVAREINEYRRVPR